MTVRLLTGSEGTISIDGTTEREPASSIKVMIAAISATVYAAFVG